MSLTREKRERIKTYLLEQIHEKKGNVVSNTARTCNVSQTTVSRYINQMLQGGIIAESDENESKYRLIGQKRKFAMFNLKEQHLEEDKIYNEIVLPIISDLPDNVKKIWAYVFTEMMNNAIEHSIAENICVTVDRNALFTHVFITDDGIGIFEKIKDYVLAMEGKEITLDEAVSFLFVGKLTTNKENHSGEGIFFSSRAVDVFYIFSSNRIFTHDKYDRNYSANLFDVEDRASKYIMLDKKGTYVFINLWNNSKRELKEVFDMFSSVDKGFFKSQIPIKNAITSGFAVSRSQARRLSSGFDKFEVIELDFSGVEDIGQAFAHEMFVVFKKNHPEIKLNIINANQSIEDMIRRVINTDD